MTIPAVSESRRSVKLERTGVTSHLHPSELWLAQEHFRDSIVSKVREAGHGAVVARLAESQTRRSFITCTNCGNYRTVHNHCDLKFCPLCTPRLAAKRRESIEAWTRVVRQPKHVVLTSRNTETISRHLTRSRIKQLSQLRRKKFARNWSGGIVSTEVTNEGRGWHLHYHMLIESRFIDSHILAKEWAKTVGEDFCIVKVKDTRDRAYLQEVTKYAVKGSDIASWSGTDIVKFIYAFQGVRTFHAFGSCFKLRAQVEKWKANAHPYADKSCECGCQTFRFMDSVDDSLAHKRKPRQFKFKVNRE